MRGTNNDFNDLRQAFRWHTYRTIKGILGVGTLLYSLYAYAENIFRDTNRPLSSMPFLHVDTISFIAPLSVYLIERPCVGEARIPDLIDHLHGLDVVFA